MAHRSIRRLTSVGVAVVVGTVLSAGAAAAAPIRSTLVADPAPEAWSVMPADAQGAPDGRTRFELTPEAGRAVTEHVLVSNTSAAEQAFVVYAADAINTATGGYDLQPRTAPPADVATWVTVDRPSLTLGPEENAVVAFTVTVPPGVVPGDHAGGIVVSPASPQASPTNVLVDTRVAVRLNVRVPGELTPQLTVQNVTATFAGTWVPFGRSPVTVTYDVVNTGNVKIVGTPRVRVTGPTGAVLGEGPTSEPATGDREVLPGQGFTGSVVLAAVPALFAEKAVVDLDMTAAPGPETEIPLVSTTGSASYAAVPWTGLALVVLAIGVAVAAIRRWRWRRSEAERLWQEMTERAGGAAAVGGTLTLLVGLAVGGGVVVAAVVGPAAPASADSDGGATVNLTVPPPPSATPSPSPTPSPGPTPSPSAAPSPSGPVPGGGGRDPITIPRVPGGGVPQETPSPEPTPSGTVVPPSGATDAAPDLTWNRPGGMSGPQTALVSMAGGGGVLAGAVALRRYLRLRGDKGAA